jgi:hypothetical protein
VARAWEIEVRLEVRRRISASDGVSDGALIAATAASASAWSVTERDGHAEKMQHTNVVTYFTPQIQ